MSGSYKDMKLGEDVVVVIGQFLVQLFNLYWIIDLVQVYINYM